ncbi:MAG: hypothetical protein IIY03_02800, partial [Muribaculaceae bacterium]|nr:hypothetical protein [Muribaculaceae bacterium]
MKYIHKIFIAISISSLLLFAATPAEAQFLKKLGNALEKVNEKLEEANEFLNDPTAKQKKQKKEKSSKNQDKALSVDNDQAAASDVEDKIEIDDSDWEEAEPNQFQSPYITKNTLFMEIPRSYRISPVHNGVFAIDQGSKYSFWKITGEKLLNAEWEYCNESDVLGQKYPLFNSGVASARRTVANAQGHKV